MAAFLTTLTNVITNFLGDFISVIYFIISLPVTFVSFLISLPVYYQLGFSLLFTSLIIIIVGKLKSIFF